MAIRKSKTAVAVGFLMILSGLANYGWAKPKKAKSTQISKEYSESLFGASNQQESFYIEDTEEGTQIVQQFSWTLEPDILKYVFVIQQENKDGEFVTLEEIETEENFVDIPLSAGKYRYKITVYNLLGIAELESDWISADVVKAYRPEITSVAPGTIYLEERQDGVYQLNGNELRPETEFVLTDGKGRSTVVATIIETDDKNRRVKIQVNPKELDTKKYTLIAKNEGGLTASYFPVTVQFKKPMDLDVSAGYTLPVIPFDDTLKTYMNSAVFPLSLSGKVNFMPFKHNFGYIGIGLEVNYIRMFYQADEYLVDGNVFTGLANFVYQYPIRVKDKYNPGATRLFMILEAHGGAGFTFFNDFKYHYKYVESKPLNSLNISWDAGFAVDYYITNRLFLDLNVDFVMSIGVDMTMGAILPTVGIGWQF